MLNSPAMFSEVTFHVGSVEHDDYRRQWIEGQCWSADALRYHGRLEGHLSIVGREQGVQ